MLYRGKGGALSVLVRETVDVFNKVSLRTGAWNQVGHITFLRKEQVSDHTLLLTRVAY